MRPVPTDQEGNDMRAHPSGRSLTVRCKSGIHPSRWGTGPVSRLPSHERVRERLHATTNMESHETRQLRAPRGPDSSRHMCRGRPIRCLLTVSILEFERSRAFLSVRAGCGSSLGNSKGHSPLTSCSAFVGRTSRSRGQWAASVIRDDLVYHKLEATHTVREPTARERSSHAQCWDGRGTTMFEPPACHALAVQLCKDSCTGIGREQLPCTVTS